MIPSGSRGVPDFCMQKNNDNIIVWNFLLNLKSIENSESLIIPQMRFINDENGTLKIKK